MNFLFNIDYEICFQCGIYVFVFSGVFVLLVVEMGLGMVFSFVRGIYSEYFWFLQGIECYGFEGNGEVEFLIGFIFGFIGFGDFGCVFYVLLFGFCLKVVWVFDFWLLNGYLE